MLRYIWALLLLTLSVMVGTQKIHALDGTDDVVNGFPFGVCTVTVFSNAQNGTAYVDIVGTSTGDPTVGGFSWTNGSRALWRDGAILASQIEYCLGAHSGAVSQLLQSGADASSFTLESYMGFAFYLTVPATNEPTINAGWHEYMVGDRCHVPYDCVVI